MKSRMPLPAEVRPPVRISPWSSEVAASGYREGGGTAGVKGRAVTSPEGAGLGSARIPINPRDVVISGLGVVSERGLQQVAAVTGAGVTQIRK